MAVHALVMLAATAPAKKSSSSGNPTLLIFVAIAAAFYFFIYRPQQRKAKAAREEKNTYDVGDEVLTAGGLVGHIIDIDGDRITLETSVGASFVVLKQYVIRRLEEPEPADDDEAEFDAEDEDEDHDEPAAGDDRVPDGPADEDHGAAEPDAGSAEADGPEDETGGDTGASKQKGAGSGPGPSGPFARRRKKSGSREDPVDGDGPPII